MSAWSAPGSGGPEEGGGQPPAFSPGAPLGGTGPVAEPHADPSDGKDLLLAAVLFVAAIIAGVSTMLPWRDFGRRFGASARSTGWVSADGSLARGWIVVLLAVLLAVAGILLAAGRVRRGRMLASASAAGLVVMAIAEWGLGLGEVRSGPGWGLWVMTGVGLAVILAVGSLDSQLE